MSRGQPTGTTEVGFDRPIDVRSSLATLGRWGDDLLDRWDGRVLVRTFRSASDAEPMPIRARVPSGLMERLTVDYAGDADHATVRGLFCQTFVTEDSALSELAGRDRRVAALVARHRGYVPVLVPDPFAALIRSISAQQVNLRWAATVRARLAQRYGRRLEVADSFVHVLEPAPLAAASVEELRELQLTNAKARAVIATARAALQGELRIEDLSALDDEALIAHLTALPGIGRWSAEWFLARTLGRPRVVAGDLGVRKAVARLYEVPIPSELEVRRLTEHWDEAATMVQALALHDLAVSPSPAPAR